MGAAPGAGRRGGGATRLTCSLEHGSERRAVRRRRGVAGAVRRRRQPQRWRWATGRAFSTGSTWPTARSRPAGATGDGQHRRVGTGLRQRQPGRRARRRRASTGSRSPGARPIDSTASVEPNGDLYFGAGQRGVAGHRRLLRLRAERGRGVEPGRDQPVHRHGTRRRRPGVARRSRNGGSLVEARFARPGDLRAATASNGAPAPGWPQFSADSVFSTAAVGDLYGTGSDDFVVGGASSHRVRPTGTHYAERRHAPDLQRARRTRSAAPTRTRRSTPRPPSVPSCPAAPTASPPARAASSRAPATRTRSRSTTPRATRCGATRSTASTGGSPALADVQGNGQLAVVEGTVTADGAGSVWALERRHRRAASGTPACGAVFGSVTTADLTGGGYQDVIVPTDHGLYILDGQTGRRLPTSTTGRQRGHRSPRLRLPERGARHRRRRRVDRHHGGRVLRHPGEHRRTSRASCSTSRSPAPSGSRRRGRRLAPVPPRRRPERVRRRRRPRSGPVRPAGGRAERLPDRGVRRRDLRLRAGLLRQHGEHRARTKPVVGMAAVPGQGGYWLVARRRRHLHLRRRRVLRLDRLPPPQRARRGHGGHARRQGLLARGVRRRHLQLRRRRVLRLGRVGPGQDIVGMAATPDGLGYWEVEHDRTGLRLRRRHLRTATPADCTSTAASSASRPTR